MKRRNVIGVRIASAEERLAFDLTSPLSTTPTPGDDGASLPPTLRQGGWPLRVPDPSIPLYKNFLQAIPPELRNKVWSLCLEDSISDLRSKGKADTVLELSHGFTYDTVLPSGAEIHPLLVGRLAVCTQARLYQLRVSYGRYEQRYRP